MLQFSYQLLIGQFFDGQGDELFDPAAEGAGHLKGERDAFLFAAGVETWIGQAPVSGYRVAGENRTSLPGGMIADGDDDIEMVAVHLLYALGFLIADRDFHALHRFHNQTVNIAGRIGAGTEGPETFTPQMFEEGFGHLGSATVTGANEQDMVGAGHNHHPFYENNSTRTAGLSTDFIVEQYFLERVPLARVSLTGLLWIGF